MKFFLTALLLTALLVNNALSAESLEPVESGESRKESVSGMNELINTGLEDIYNLKFEEAKKIFKRVQTEYPKNIEGYFFESLIYFHSAAASRDEAQYEKFMDVSSDVIIRCEDMLDENENDLDALYYKGQSHSYRSLLMLALNKSLISAASNGNSGYRLLSEVIERNPSYYDAYMGLGLYRIAIEFVPDKFQWLLSIIGFEGNLKEGIRMLETAVNRGRFTQVDAKVYLSIFSIKESEEENGETKAMLRSLTERYPESPFFSLIYASALQQTGEMDESIRYTEKALALNKHSLQNEIKKGAFIVLGNAYFRKNDFPKAIANFEEHLKYVTPEDRYNISLFHLGIAYEMIGQREKALENYRKTRTEFIEERDGEAEKIFHRYARQLTEKPFNEYDSLLITGMNLCAVNKPDDALKIYSLLLTSPEYSQKYKSDDEKIRLYMHTGNAYTVKKDDDLAIDYFTRCTNLDPEKEKWLIPHAYFELGKIYNRKGDRAKANEMFDMVYDFSDYDFKNFLEMRVQSYRAKM